MHRFIVETSGRQWFKLQRFNGAGVSPGPAWAASTLNGLGKVAATQVLRTILPFAKPQVFPTYD